jgi:pimeloyl-ACP methyl ester carboxylesterase
MAEHSSATAPTRFAEVGDTCFAYRRFGSGPKLSLVMINHFRGNLDTHDPAIVDPLSTDREIILFNSAGVASSTGTPKVTVKEMAGDAAAFIDAIGLEEVDLYGISMGGYVAQQLAVDRPNWSTPPRPTSAAARASSESKARRLG